ncbi:MAG TPA: zinc-ribbon domain-containing protein [Thermomicrobiales bacterium]|jgi:predicted ATP-dependent serine protease
MSTNEERCSNCGTINPEGQDKCVKCGMPLTASAEEALRTNLAAQQDSALMGVRNDMTGLGSGLPSAEVNPDPNRRDPEIPFIPERPA